MITMYIKTGLQITTYALANVGKFSCGRPHYENLIAHMASENLPELFQNPLAA
jgi:hypothetical protein